MARSLVVLLHGATTMMKIPVLGSVWLESGTGSSQPPTSPLSRSSFSSPSFYLRTFIFRLAERRKVEIIRDQIKHNVPINLGYFLFHSFSSCLPLYLLSHSCSDGVIGPDSKKVFVDLFVDASRMKKVPSLPYLPP